MGSEHSTHSTIHSSGGSIARQSTVVAPSGNGKSKAALRRQHTIANPGDGSASTTASDDGETARPGSISPGPSVCSDTDLPYISYTVNRPIGDSPKLTNKQAIIGKSNKIGQRNNKLIPLKIATTKKSAPVHNIVVVKSAANAPNLDRDPDIVQLQSIPMFLPIMRATLNLPAARDPEVLERLDPIPLHRLCVKYQNYLTTCANLVATEQNSLTQKIRETDQEISRIVNNTVEKQKKFAKYAEKLSKVQDLSHQLNRCHMLLNQTLESMETLNNYLDIDERLEPFVWTTG